MSPSVPPACLVPACTACRPDKRPHTHHGGGLNISCNCRSESSSSSCSSSALVLEDLKVQTKNYIKSQRAMMLENKANRAGILTRFQTTASPREIGEVPFFFHVPKAGSTIMLHGAPHKSVHFFMCGWCIIGGSTMRQYAIQCLPPWWHNNATTKTPDRMRHPPKLGNDHQMSAWKARHDQEKVMPPLLLSPLLWDINTFLAQEAPGWVARMAVLLRDPGNTCAASQCILGS